MIDVILDSLKDSLSVFVFVFITYIVLSFFESKLVNKLRKGNGVNPFFASLFGLIPQCGVSVIAADLYSKKYLSIGSLIALFLACSDEGIIILLTSNRALVAIPLILSKLIIGVSVGFFIDLLIKKNLVVKDKSKSEENVTNIECNCVYCVVEEEDEITGFDIHVWYPFIRSLKIVGVVFSLNLLFGLIVYLIGENNIHAFLEFNKYLAPLFSTIIGLIPNCASSIIITNLYVNSAISFGSLLSGLLVNAGMGMLIIFKRRDMIKDNIIVLSILIVTSILFGYIASFIIGF